ncbi:hypothetical protein [Ectopseudomonas oleovorans]|uniref:hypothetical protein n=1 Tax=Ectopseudomonas oleovorans TaxID=301 RepID=UPI0035B040F2
MSELRIALVAEGPTDYELIHAALRAILPDAFQMTLLQPETTQPQLGNGWPGVLKWCHTTSQRHNGSLDTDPTLEGYDLLIIHLDTDVALMSYANCGTAVTNSANQFGWQPLPCNQPCPPVTNTCAQLQAALISWLTPAAPGKKSVWCLPAQSTGSWLAAAALKANHPLLQRLECDPTVEDALTRLPKAERIKKSVPEYRRHADSVRSNWTQVKALCSQAQVFEQDVLAAV